jgi:IclR family acetate operon transcriptional repressor
MLSRFAKPALDAYLGRKLEVVTPRTLSDPTALAHNLLEAKAKGYALGDGEVDLEVRAVASAITIDGGEPIAAMSISCPATRFPDSKIETYGELIRAAASRVSADIAKAP